MGARKEELTESKEDAFERKGANAKDDCLDLR